MESFGIAASVFTVATVALQSASIIHETICGIKNGPKEVNELALAVQQLCHILRQVTEISKTFGDRDAQNIVELQNAIDQCRRNLDDFRKQFEKIEVLPNEKRVGKAWKRVKLVVQKGDFRRMWEKVNYYVSVLGTHLGLIGREMDNNHKVEFARSVQQNSVDSQILRQNNVILNQVDHTLGALGNDFARLETQRGMEFSMLKDGHHATESLRQRVDDLTSISKDQCGTLLEKLVELQKQVEDLKSANVQPPERRPPPGVEVTDDWRQRKEEDHENNDRITELSESIIRLSSLATTPRKTLFSEEAQSIISDLEKILILVSKEAKPCETKETRKRKSEQESDLQVEASPEYQTERDLRRMHGLLISSQLITVNQVGFPGINFHFEDRRRRETTSQQYVTEAGLVSVQVKKRKLFQDVAQHDILTDEFDQRIVDVFEGTINLIPASNFSRTKISTSFLQKLTVNGYMSLKPTLSFTAIIPDDSEIFTLTRRGDLQGIIDHVQQGYASLTDCDTKGRTLLNYALSTFQVEVSRFLIERGADVDAMEPVLFVVDNSDLWRKTLENTLMPHLFQTHDLRSPYKMRQNKLNLIWKCRRLLLEAGADPTNQTCGSYRPGTSLLSDILVANHLDSLKMLFDLGAEFIDLEEKNKYGETPLLRCSSSGVRVDPDCIKFLLDRGASVKAKDYRGCTCLHLLFSPSFIHWQIDPGVRDSLILLVKAGANVHARTNAGESVFDVAYESGCGNADAASRIRLWAEVLTACGYDGARLHEDWRSRRFPDQSDVVKESSVEGNASSNMQDIEKEFGVDEQNLQDIGKELCVDEQDLQDNEPGFDQDLYTDEGSPRVYAQGFGRNSHVDERYLQGEELDYDVFTNDSNITSLSYESRTNATETGFALHGVEESIYANAWSDEIVDGQSMSWDPSPPGQMMPSNSSVVQNRVFEIEGEEAQIWDNV